MSDTIRFQADKNLESHLTQANSFEEVRGLLENASVRSGIGHRDAQGRFVAVETDSQRAAVRTKPAEDEPVTKVVVIGGQEFTFEGTALEVEQAIRQAYQVAEALKSQADPAMPVTPRGDRNTSFDHPITEYLAERGFDVDEAAQQQLEKSWAAATQEFLQDAGGDWPGGQKNMELIGLKILELGLEQAPDKVAALVQAYESMKEKGMMFESDYTPEQAIKDTATATPQEILESWKQAQNEGDPESANSAFIKAFQHGRSSGVFNR